MKTLPKLLTALACASLLLSACNNKTVPEHDHVWDKGEITKESTCHSEGLRTFKCTVDGCAQTKTESVAMKPHSWDEGVVTTEPTCSQTGVKTFSCTNEGCDKTKTVTLEKTDHKYVFDNVNVIPDLLTNGEEEYKCSMCDELTHREVEAHADFVEQFANEKFPWVFASLASYESSDEDLSPVPLTKEDGVYKNSNIEISKGHIKVNGVALLSYVFESDLEKISVMSNVSFNGKEDNTRVEAYLLLTNSNNHVLEIRKISDDSKSWQEEASNEHLFNLRKGYRVSLVVKSLHEGVSEGDLSFTITAKCVHIFNEGEVIKEATTLEKGTRQYTCIVCGEKVEHDIPMIIPDVDPLEGYFDFTGKVENRFDTGYIGKSLITERGHTLHVQITKAGPHIWEGGVFINTGVTFEANKMYEISFETERKAEENFEIVFQNKQWDTTAENVYRTLYTPLGAVDEYIRVTEDNQGPLWIYVQFGDVVNEVVLTKMLIRELGPDPLEGYFDFEGKIEERIDADYEGKASLEPYGHTLNFEITKAGPNIWEGGVFINTGVTLEADKAYTVSFEVAREKENDFEIVFQNKQWDTKAENIYTTLYSPVGAKSVLIEAKGAKAGPLWIYIQSGNAINKISLTKLLIEETGSHTLKEYFDFEGKVEERFDSEYEGNVSLKNFGHTLNFAITKAGPNIWEGGVFVNTGVTLAAGKAYTVSFEASREQEENFEIIFQNKQWDTDASNILRTLYSPTGEVSETLEIKEKQAGPLWIYIQSGNAVNNITLTKLSIKETGSDTMAEYFDFEDHFENRFGAGYEGNTSLTNFGHTLSLEVTKAGTDIWEAGVFVNTNYTLEASKSYKVKFEISATEENNFEIILQNKQWDEVKYKTLFTPDGEVEEIIEVRPGEQGSLWIYVQSGTALNKITLSKLTIEEVGTDPLTSYFDFTDRFENRVETGYEVKTALSNFGHTLNFEVVTPGADIWAAGVFVNTGVSMTAGKSYTVSFEVSAKENEDFEIILQNKQWDEVKYVTLSSPSGEVGKTIEVKASNAGTLWLYVQSGTAANTITLSKLKVVEAGSDPLSEYFDFEGHIENRFGSGYEGRSSLSEFGHTLDFEVTKAGTDIWEAGIFINTGVTMTAGKSYAVSFEVSKEQEEDFEIILQNKQWDEAKYKVLASPTGEVSTSFEVKAANAGTLWIYIQSGTAVNKFTLTKLTVTESGSDLLPEYFDFEGKTVERFEAGYEGKTTLSNFDHTLDFEITTAGTDIWAGGLFINTGVSFNAGKAYRVSFEVEREVDNNFEIILQNKQWDEIKYKTLYSPDGAVSETFEIRPGQEGSLWIYIQSGNAENKITFTKLLIEEVGSDAMFGCVDFTGKLAERFEAGYTGNTAVSNYGHTLDFEVTTAGTDIWAGGVFINTGITLEAGKGYDISFEVSAEEASAFEIIFQNKQWDIKQENIYKTCYSPDGEVNFHINVNGVNEGSLWIYIQSGTATNKITLTKLSVEEAEFEYEYFVFTGNVIAKIEGTVVGEVKVDELDPTKASLTITTVGNIWEGGMFINTGISANEGDEFKITFVLENENGDSFEVAFQNKQWDEVKYVTLYSPDSPVEVTFTVTDSNTGTLWIYIQFGNKVNTVTISQLYIDKI